MSATGHLRSLRRTLAAPVIVLAVSAAAAMLLGGGVWGATATLAIGACALGWMLVLVRRRDREMTRAREAAEAATRAKGEFLAMMSHEIRTPMNAVIGMTELLLRTALDERQTRYLTTLRTSADSLLVVINDILDLSKIEAGRLELRQVDFDLRELVEEVCAAHGALAQLKKLELVCDVPPSLETGVRGDPDRLRQVLMNLMSNAIKFTEAGEVTVRVRAASGEGAGPGSFEVRVIDTGIGMTAEERERLFTPFWQADSSSTRKKGGTGLGLAIAGRLVSLMDSEFEVTSEPGKGTTFAFRLELDLARAPLPRPARTPLPALRVLVVDDHEANRVILSEQLEAWGLRPTAVEGGTRALASWVDARGEGEPFDLVLLDGHMPDMNGFDVAMRMRELERGPDVTKLVMLTSLDAGEEQAKQARLDDWLTKPVRQAQLFDCVSRLFSEPAPPRVTAAAGSNDLTAAAAAAVAAAGGGVAAEPVKVRRRSPTGAPMRRDARILLVEDNEVNQAVATEMLGELGLDVTIAANGAEAVEAVRKQAFDLVLMDCQMPVLDGYEATAQIRHMEGNARHTIIVALTAHAIGDSREISLAAGMDDFLPKPVTVESLMATLDRWLTAAPMSPAARTATLRMPPLPQVDTGVIEDRARTSAGAVVLLDPAVTRKRRFVEIFLQLAPRDVERIQAAGDARALSAGAHRLKGSAFALGLRQLAHTCEELERLGAANDLSGAGGVVTRLTSELDATCRALEAELAGQRN